MNLIGEINEGISFYVRRMKEYSTEPFTFERFERLILLFITCCSINKSEIDHLIARRILKNVVMFWPENVRGIPKYFYDLQDEELKLFISEFIRVDDAFGTLAIFLSGVIERGVVE